MRRTLSILAATALAAAFTIPALAQDDGGGKDSGFTRFTSCLRDNGVDVPAGLDPVAVKRWLGEHQDQAPIAAALQNCGKPADNGFAELYSCLRSHGVDVESSPDAVKRKVVELNGSDAGRATLKACHVSVDKDPTAGDNAKGCGGPPQVAPDQPASKPQS